jgi:IS30 family transposase
MSSIHTLTEGQVIAIDGEHLLLRQYVKKGTDLTTVTDSDIEFAVSRINYRPKKCLDFKQPAIVFKEMALVA